MAVKKGLRHEADPHVDNHRSHRPIQPSYTRNISHLIVVLLVLNLIREIPQQSIFTCIKDSFSSTPEGILVSIQNDVDWDKSPTLPYLSYKPCYNGCECARLELPLDHFNGTTDATISLAVIRKPAIVPVTSPYYGGAIIMNPGGPGGSGIDMIAREGDALRVLVDSPHEAQGAKFYDLISFDPRGVRLSTPRAHCFQTNRAYSLWHARMNEEGSVQESDAALDRLWAMSYAEGHSCEHFSIEHDIKHYMSTAYSAADILQLTEAHGAWRHAEAQRLLSRGRHGAVEVSSHLRFETGQERIQYWGFSYGTFLGTTFAAMYPDRIARFVLDGVEDAEVYAHLRRDAGLVDTEKAIAAFYTNCARVGPTGCAFAEEGVSAANISARAEAIVKRLRGHPLPVIAPNPDVLTHHKLRQLIASSLYSPIKSFPRLASTLAAVEQGIDRGWIEESELLSMLDMSSTSFSVSSSNSDNDHPDDLNLALHDNNLAAHNAVMCTDGDDVTNLTQTAFLSSVSRLQTLSPTIGDLWSEVLLACRGWKGRAVHRFNGPWTGNTSHPILFIGNAADPVCPVSAAHKMAKRFEGSVVLTVDGPGHTASAVPSLCWVKHLRAYLHDGVLPEEGTVCQAEVVPFGPGVEQLAAERVAGEEEAKMLRALDEVALGVRVGRRYLGGIDIRNKLHIYMNYIT